MIKIKIGSNKKKIFKVKGENKTACLTLKKIS